MLKNKLIILGCGASGGVPGVGNYWGSCDPSHPKNSRTRSSVYWVVDGTRILIDTSPDLRHQMLKNQIVDIDAVLYTHTHADHTHGIDDLRGVFFQRGQKKIPVYGTETTIRTLQKQFGYLFHGDPFSIYPQILDPHIIHDTFSIGSLNVRAFPQIHGQGLWSTGFRIGNIAYSTDFNDLEEDSLKCLTGLDLWIVDCLSIDPRPTHMHLEGALEWIAKVQPKKAILTHMNTTLDYETLFKTLPSHVEVAYDGLTIYF